MPKTRKLSDLYVVGKDVTISGRFDDGERGEITVRVQKLNPVAHETALRKANAARAGTLLMSRLPEDSEERSDFMNQLFDIAKNKDETIDFLAGEYAANKYPAIEAEIAAEDEWSNDDYLQGLKDSWEDELKAVYANGPKEEDEGEEYARSEKVMAELLRFQDQVYKEVESQRQSFRKDIATRSEESLINEAVNKLIESQADMNWLTEYRKCEVWLGVLDAKTKKHYFSTRAEVDELAPEVLGEIIRAYAELNVDTVEGKD